MNILYLSTILSCFLSVCNAKTVPEITNLKCEMINNPVGIDHASPRLSWEITSKDRSVMQKSYQIMVASSLEKLNSNQADLWDSKQVRSDVSVFLPYAGKTLESRMECYWKVRVVTNKGTSNWSQPAKWTMGLIHAGEWQAKWIGLNKSFDWEAPTAGCTRLAARYFRKEFEASQQPVKATLYLCGLGLYKLHMNGEVIGDQELAPTPTDYTKVAKYNTFDVSKNIQKGANAIGVVVGNGRFFHMRGNPNFEYPKMILQLELEYADGSRQTVLSDDTWKVTADGPIRANNEYDGEEYDACKEMPGWNKAGFTSQKWFTAEYIEEKQLKLEAQLNQNIKVMDVIRPIDISELKTGTYILDMGQNMTGWLRMKVTGKRGEQVKLRFAEFLNKDGNINQENLRGGLATDIYTLKGEGNEIWEPIFTSHGFRFVEITGFSGTPTINDFEGRVVHDDMELTGNFKTSNPLINQIYKNAYWSIRGNYRGMPTDCPQRTERMGWTGDRAVGSYGESYIFNNNDLYAKWLDDIATTQREDGSLSDIAPSYWNSYSDNMTWPGTYLMVANMLYERFGNKEPIVKHYESMKKWLYYMRDKYMTPDHIMPRDVYGDWCMPPESPELDNSKDPTRITDAAVIGTAYYYYMLELLEKFAGILNKPEDAKRFVDEAIVIKDAYNKKFLNTQTGQYSNNTVTANLLSLSFGMVSEEYKQAVFQNIVNKTMKEFNGHISTGLIGCQWLMRGLTDNGRPDIAYQMLTNTDYPSFGYMIKNGATTMWEHWNGNTLPLWIDSQNHVMLLGDLIVWFYENVAGIKNARESYGYKKLTMKPLVLDGLNTANASFHSVHGLVKSSWKKDNKSFHWELTVPCNATATVYIPASSRSVVTENGGKPSSKNIKFVKMDGSYAVFEVGSGSYSFLSAL